MLHGLTNVPSIHSSCSFIAGSFGVVALCAHTIAYNLIPLLFMLPLGISIGLTVRIGTVIAYDAEKAKLMAGWTMLLTAALGAVIACSLHFFQLPIISLFTKDDQVILECQAIWPKVSYYVFLLYIFGINGAILRGTL
jgi:MATE family multidrug resistance protein